MSSKRQEYKIPHRSLPEGKHSFEFQLDAGFFEGNELFDEYSGSLEASVTFLKKDSKQQLEILLKGMLKTVCDRCLDSMELPFKAKGTYYLREAEDGEEEKEDVIFVQRENVEVDLEQVFYELFLLNIPQKKKHKKKECNPEMLEKLENLKIREEKTIDPRWAALEKLRK